MADPSKFTPNDFNFQVDYDPNSRMLDHRGSWTKQIAAQFGLKEWAIRENTLTAFDTAQTKIVAVGFRKANLIWNDCETFADFPTHIEKFANTLFSLEAFTSAESPELLVARIGVRGRFAIAFEGGADSLAKRIETRILNSQPQNRLLTAVGEEGASLIDLVVVHRIQSDDATVNIQTTPYKREELGPQIFPRRELDSLPPVSLFVDVDAFFNPEMAFAVSSSQLIERSSRLARTCWRVCATTREMVLGAE